MNEPLFIDLKKIPIQTRLNYSARHFFFKHINWIVLGTLLVVFSSTFSGCVKFLDYLRWEKKYYRFVPAIQEPVLIIVVLVVFFGFGAFLCWIAGHAQEDFWDSYLKKLAKRFPNEVKLKDDSESEPLVRW